MSASYQPRKLQKRPQDDIAYTFDFSEWTFLGSDALASAAVTADVAGLTIGSPSILSGGKKAQVTISGGTAGVTYAVTCVGTTTAGRDVTGDVYLELVAP